MDATNRMALNPFEPPAQAERPVQRAKGISGLWIAVAYIMPQIIMIATMSEAIWYRTGNVAWLWLLLRIVAFFIGASCAYFALLFGSNPQRLVAVPVALGYSAFVIGTLWTIAIG